MSVGAVSVGAVNTSKPPVLTIEPVGYVTTHDGDTFRVQLPMQALVPGAASWIEDVRLAHVNAAELSTPDGKLVRDATSQWLNDAYVNDTLRLLIWGREKYGRLLADVQRISSGALLSEFVATQAGTKPMAVAELLVTPS